MAEFTALIIVALCGGGVVLGIFYFFLPFIVLGKLTDIIIEGRKTNAMLSVIAEEQLKANGLSRQLLRSYGHEPVA